jgi:hypothetical protein
MRRLLFISIAFSIAGKLHAQRPETALWLNFQVPVHFSSRWQMHNDFSYRTLGADIAANSYSYNTGIRYLFNKQWSTGGGVEYSSARTTFNKANDEFGHDFRIWEELSRLEQLNKKLLLQLRFKAEERFIFATSLKDKYTALRLRLRTVLTQKLNVHWGIQFTDEYLQQLAKQKFVFDQNRVMLTAIRYLNSSSQFQCGYLWLKWPTEHQHILTFRFIKTISFHGT